MQEYIVTAQFDDGTEDDIKTYGKNIADVLDSMVTLPVVKDIIKVIRKEDDEQWYFKGSLELLRELRQAVESESAIREQLEQYEKEINNGK